mgnify:CR=1 FL=1
MEKIELPDNSSVVLVRDNNKCIRCGRCINVCAKVQAVSAICATGEGLDKTIAPPPRQGPGRRQLCQLRPVCGRVPSGRPH